MKKNVMMRVASIMLVLVLMTSSVISGTFAKYTTQDAGSDEARVAKWGVELQVIGNLYGTSYDNNIVVSADDADDKIEVQAVDYKLATASDVVAPGTQNTEGFTFSLKGKPEVDGEVDVTIITQNIFLKAGNYGVMIPVDAGVVTEGNFTEFADDLYIKSASGDYTKVTGWAGTTTYYTLEDEVELTKDYYPVEYSIKRGAAPLGGGGIDADSFEAVIAKLAKFTFTKTDKGEATTEYVAETVEFQTNQQLEEVCLLNDLVVTWEWKFEQPVNTDMYNGADTILGNLMTAKLNSGKVVEGEVVKLDTNYVALVEYSDYCLETQFSIDIAATQVN